MNNKNLVESEEIARMVQQTVTPQARFSSEMRYPAVYYEPTKAISCQTFVIHAQVTSSYPLLWNQDFGVHVTVNQWIYFVWPEGQIVMLCSCGTLCGFPAPTLTSCCSPTYLCWMWVSFFSQRNVCLVFRLEPRPKPEVLVVWGTSTCWWLDTRQGNHRQTTTVCSHIVPPGIKSSLQSTAHDIGALLQTVSCRMHFSLWILLCNFAQ